MYIFLATFPFILGGYYFSILFRQFARVSSKLYFADLVGAGLGSLIVIQLLNYVGIFKTVFVISLLALVSATRQLSKDDRNNIIPVLWGINGLMSVVGSVLSVIISMQFGFTATLISGTVFYTMVMFFDEI